MSLDDAMRATARSWAGRVWAGVLLLVGGVLAFLPLFDGLGFEASFAIGIVASFATADLGARLARRARETGDGGVAWTFGLWARAALLGLVGAAVPHVVLALNALRVPQCDWLDGLKWAAVLPGLSIAAAAAVGVLAPLVLRRPRLAIAAPWLVIVASLLAAGVGFYRAPPVFAYDPFGGWFPGSVYDEELALEPAFAWARIYQAAAVIAALLLVAAWRDRGRARVGGDRRRRRVVVAGGVVALVIALVVRVRSGALGFAPSADEIARALGGRYDTAHVTIYYPREASFAPDIARIGEEHELRLAQVARTLGVAPPHVTSFYFASPAEKRRWMGAARVYIAKPWRREIYVQHDDPPHDVIRHELAHVVAGEFGDPIFHVALKWFGWPPVRFNMGLIEGLAVAADWPGGRGRPTPHQAARALLDAGKLPRIARLLAPGFLEHSAALSYTVAGSFVRHLLDAHGAAPLRALYRAGGTPADFPGAYGQSLDQLEAEWHAVLRATSLDRDEAEVARDRMRRPGIFSRPCPHVVARRLAEATVLARSGRAPEAVALLRGICGRDPDPIHRLALAAALERAGDVAGARAELADIASADTTSLPAAAQALVALTDLEARAGDLGAASVAAAAAAAMPLDESARRQLVVRRQALDAPAPLGPLLRTYLFEHGGRDASPTLLLHDAEELARGAPSSGLGPYLVGRLLVDADAHAAALAPLAEAFTRGLDDPLLVREAARLRCIAGFVADDPDAVRAGAAILAADGQPLGVKLEAADWLDLLALRAELRARGPGTPPR